ncbi:hypothetical protein MUN78_16505 [Leucobacter allii]|uniref:Uncharacterized protein n=1 Tax=Leucobacter allii TaxID=2932247 RepID=A0ABY4FLR1_9MICO|nr:hypothetical protein [Leucobacter allii]UOQ57232.1 hypothetical protein MUN78_16505 [Leucobacter allii]
MTVRPIKCPTGDHPVRVLEYLPAAELIVEHAGVTHAAAREALVKYECTVCGVIVEHHVSDMTPAQLQQYGYQS